jgi:nucleotide-binding universal stress UspA family protein
MSLPYQKIFVPLDGSELSARALPHAAEIARGSHAKLVLSQIVEAPAEFVAIPTGMRTTGSDTGAGIGGVSVGVTAPDDETHSRTMDEIQAYLDRVATSLRHQKIEVEVDVNTGDPATTIVNYATANAVDLIVMSTHGRTGLGRWTYGSVTNKVLQAAPCPVLVVR